MRLLCWFLKKELPIAAGFSGRWRIRPLKGDGSDRRVFRVLAGKRTYIAVVHPGGRLGRPSENDSFFYIGTHLRSKGVPTPAIISFDRKRGLFLLEDFGDVSLESIIKGLTDSPKTKSLYEDIIRLLIKVQLDGAEGFDPRRCYDTPIYDGLFSWERESRYFLEAFLKKYQGWEKPPSGLEAELKQLALMVDGEKSRFFLYRDFQSRNIMMVGNGFGLIDFQAGRLGPPQYDLASLLIDPYVGLSEERQEELLDFYLKNISKKVALNPLEFRRNYEIIAFQRNLQVLGAFAFLSRVKGKTYFETFIPQALRSLKNRVRRDLFKPFETIRKICQGIRVS
jgi:N-acetylmuramate 1-kinase